ncbi:MAG: hypothetical protein COB20_06985 [SAR86 cluster bacterium]|uniref:DUF1330 domain-containing protein n=1 Tax=SAR86 cluster bacterium TaxID=2030880 RepID=A0A2A4X5Z6_9GAMM|nr:MAG: hypothetical protein COB20_06985 [SAR86 cluster bacterium]
MITIVALLTIRDADAFDRFERQAIAIMEAYDGRLDSAFRPGVADSKAAPHVDEIHVLKFPDLDSFNRYRNDDKLLSLATLREKAISQSTVYVSTIEVDYAAQG